MMAFQIIKPSLKLILQKRVRFGLGLEFWRKLVIVGPLLSGFFANADYSERTLRLRITASHTIANEYVVYLLFIA
jgi:hypothetical protein